MTSVDWGQVAAILAVAGGLSGFAVWLLRAQLGRFFVARHEHEDLPRRVKRVEESLGTLAKREDVVELERLVARTNERVAQIGATVDATKESVDAVRNQLGMVIMARLRLEESGT